MRAAGVLVLAIASGCFAMSPVMTFGGGKSKTEAQRDMATKMTPPALVVDAEWAGAVTTAKIRVYADDDFRAQNVHWQQTFQAQLDYANEVLGSLFGVKLDAEYRTWNRRQVGGTLSDGLAELIKLDPGGDVMTVVGLTSSLSLVAATFEQIGYASVPGRHLMLRGYADVGEKKTFEAAFKELKPEERLALYEGRRRHKTAALLLHELGHNWGAHHRDEADTLMSPQYSERTTGFDAASRETILASIDARLHRPPRQAVRASTTVAAAPVPIDGHTTLVIAIDAAGRSLIGGNVVDDDTLAGLLRMSYDDDHDTVIIVRPERGAPAAAVTKAAERAKAAGLVRVSTVTTS